MERFSQTYAEDELNSARDTVRKMQFLFKAQKEINELSEQLEDELF